MTDRVPRILAQQDLESAVDFYLNQAGAVVALRFIDTVERAYRLIGERPGVGSRRLANELDLPDLRSWPLPGFPYVIFYLAQPEHIDVWRILHASSDIPTWLSEGETRE